MKKKPIRFIWKLCEQAVELTSSGTYRHPTLAIVKVVRRSSWQKGNNLNEIFGEIVNSFFFFDESLQDCFLFKQVIGFGHLTRVGGELLTKITIVHNGTCVARVKRLKGSPHGEHFQDFKLKCPIQEI